MPSEHGAERRGGGGGACARGARDARDARDARARVSARVDTAELPDCACAFVAVCYSLYRGEGGRHRSACLSPLFLLRRRSLARASTQFASAEMPVPARHGRRCRRHVTVGRGERDGPRAVKKRRRGAAHALSSAGRDDSTAPPSPPSPTRWRVSTGVLHRHIPDTSCGVRRATTLPYSTASLSTHTNHMRNTADRTACPPLILLALS